MYIDFDGRYDHPEPIGGAIRKWDGVLLSVVVHALVIALAFAVAQLPFFTARQSAELIQPPDPNQNRQFVFVQPRLDLESPKPPERAEASDKDRLARSAEAREPLRSPLPAARGDSSERIEASPDLRARGRGPDPEPTPETTEETVRPPVDPKETQPQLTLPQQKPQQSGGSLGEALKNLQKYVDQESFDNKNGKVQDLGPLQFDTKGVEFGPWIRRFVAQVRRNWFVPYAAMTMRGHVVLTFNVHRNGALTDVQVVQPSAIESFNVAAMNALLASNPTQPLPPEYPADKAFFTVTFYYNEVPGR